MCLETRWQIEPAGATGDFRVDVATESGLVKVIIDRAGGRPRRTVSVEPQLNVWTIVVWRQSESVWPLDVATAEQETRDRHERTHRVDSRSVSSLTLSIPDFVRSFGNIRVTSHTYVFVAFSQQPYRQPQ